MMQEFYWKKVSSIIKMRKRKTICIYNEKEQLIEEQTYDSLLHLEGKIVFIYDKYGNIAEEKWYDNKNQRTSHIKTPIPMINRAIGLKKQNTIPKCNLVSFINV